MEQYDGAPAVKDALRVMIRCYNELDYAELAANTEKVFRENYPEDSLGNTRKSKHWWRFWKESASPFWKASWRSYVLRQATWNMTVT